MTAAHIEHRPLASAPKAGTTNHAVVVGGREIRMFKTQNAPAPRAINPYTSPGNVIGKTQIIRAIGGTIRSSVCASATGA